MKSLLLLPCLTLAALAAEPVPEFKGGLEKLDPALDALISPETKIEVLATGFNWSEGPVWKDGQILFSDVPENTVFAWKEGDTAAEREPETQRQPEWRRRPGQQRPSARREGQPDPLPAR